MGYFIHNKYDTASVTALAALDQSAYTVIDYYGEYETYKNLDTSAGFGVLYDSLSYITRGTALFDGQSDKNDSHFNFMSLVKVEITPLIKNFIEGICKNASSPYTVDIPLPDVLVKNCVIITNSQSTSYPAVVTTRGEESVTLLCRSGCVYQILELDI